MPIDLAGAVVAWLVAALGDSGVRLIRGPRDEREMRKAMRMAIQSVTGQVAPPERRALRAALNECFSARPQPRPDASALVGPWLRAAIKAQVYQLTGWVNNDTGRPFFQEVPVDPGWLAEQVADALVGALRQVVAAQGLAELVRGVDHADVMSRLEDLGLQIRQLGAPAPTVTRSLPRDISSFTGRSAELDGLMQSLEDRSDSAGTPVVAIDGMAGVGKTAFAVHAAGQLASRFPDGQVFLPLHAHTAGQRPVDSADALASLLLSAGIDAARIPHAQDDRAALWRRHLADKNVLLLLDDACGHDQVRPLLPGTRGSLVLVTSRHRLTALDDVITISLAPLRPEEAAALFTRLSARPGSAGESQAIGEITRLCGYLPLAIGILARQLSHHRAWSASDLAAELAATRDRLAIMRNENLSVAAAFDLCYQDMSDEQQQMFRRLGLHPGTDIDARAAAALDRTDLASARRLLEDLYDRHLITEPARARYRFHDLIGEHARGLARTESQAERQAAADRLLDYYLNTSIIASSRLAGQPHAPSARGASDDHPASAADFPADDQALSWLTADLSNLRAVIDYSALHQRPRHAIEISAALHDFLRTQGLWDQALAIHKTALTAAQQANDRNGQALCFTNLGHAQYLTDQYPDAIASQNEALVLYRDLGDLAGQAKALARLGDVQYMKGSYSEAMANHAEALSLYRELRDRSGEADTLTSLGIVHYLTGHYPEAVTCQAEAAELYRDLGDRPGQANALIYLGLVQYQTGQYPAATASLTEALQIYREHGNPLGQANALRYLGMAQYQTGHYPAAAESLTEALRISRSLGDKHGEAESLTHQGILRYLTGDFADAAGKLTEALRICDHIGYLLGRAGTLTSTGLVQQQMGDYSAAGASHAEALDLYREFGDRGCIAEVLNNTGKLKSASSAYAEARALHEQALSLAHSIGMPLEEARALEGIGQCLIHQDLSEEGTGYLRRAIGIYQRLGVPDAQRVNSIILKQGNQD